jgi:DNA-binding LacI/PurR family transcriptional regulator
MWVDTALIGKQAVHKLLQMLAGESTVTSTLVVPHLGLRESTGPLRRG